MPTPPEELKASLEGHNAEFEVLLRLIPAKYYLVPEDSGEHVSKYQKNSKKQKAPKQATKEASKKAKRDKFDPANNKSIIELQEEAALKKTSTASKNKGKTRAPSDDEDNDSEEADWNTESIHMKMDVDGEDGEDGDRDDPEGGETARRKAGMEFKPMPAPSSIETLRAKLRARMEELRQKNGFKGANGDPGSKDELLEERRRQRAAMRERRRKETKEKKRREREEKEKGNKGKEKAQTSAPTTKTQLLVPDVTNQQNTSNASKYTNVTFSTLAGNAPTAPKSIKTSSNPTQALKQLTKRAEARATLSTEKRKELEERDAWTKAGARVTGAKVHDDALRLHKAAKRREKDKVKSKKEWDTRKEELAKAQAVRQKKRADNIAMRHEKKKGGAGAKGKKNVKRRPGFEGKSFGGGGKKVGVSGKGKGRK
ncbi:uncharacterized protein FOMMEDRAFT_108766 [Fomitiporia mediterranea MF3/22]|uniref:uncharacterized protein n=1 Tax=Fomitiporia mediterranea (strain MF3/22) TaxID=694068 RepID=UPI0004409738|nr:uncharacterized protein FOMMEDRAFT_108766 [Fomitiporia mediterranea MF3/22]EJD01809.1 hypothetical protein FOMMEDRAFT_108766 [Fomitiporia mediterranea MF3/22]